MDQWYEDAAKTIAIIRDKQPILAVIGADTFLQSALMALNIRPLVLQNASHWADSSRHAQAAVIDGAHAYHYSHKSLRDAVQQLKRRKTPWVLTAHGAAWSRSVAFVAQDLMSRAPVAVVATAADATAVQQGGGVVLSLANRFMKRGHRVSYITLHPDAVHCALGQKTLCLNNATAPRPVDSVTDHLTSTLTAALVAVFQLYNAPAAAAAMVVQSARIVAQNSCHGGGSYITSFIDGLSRFSAEKAARCVNISYTDESVI